MPFKIVYGDITEMKVDAVVNAANTRLLEGGGVCGAIFKAAGADELGKACREIGFCETGAAVITPGFKLSAKYIIHTVGPVWHGGSSNEEKLLKSCYVNSLALADAAGCCSIAFPLISSGIFGYPPQAAQRAAEEAIAEFLEKRGDIMEVYLVLFRG